MNMNMPVANAPTPSGGGPKPFYQVWISALTKPNEATYSEIASTPNAKPTTAYLWVFIGFLVEFVLSGLVSGSRYSGMLGQYGGSGLGSGIVGTLITAICGGPILAVIATLFFAIGTAIIQWIAKMFGGQGTYNQLVYVFAAIATPFALIAGVLSLFAAIPYVGLCFSIILFVAALYVLVLNIIAVKGVNQFGWGQAAGSVLIPLVVILLVCGCLAGITALALGSAISNVFNSINQSLAP